MVKEELFSLYKAARSELWNRWNRVLPFGECFTDRWEKAKFLGFGEGSSIYDDSIIMGTVKVGKNTWIGPSTLLDGSGGGIEVGNNCNISAGVQIYTHDTVKKCLSANCCDVEQAPVKIGDDCYIGPMSIISRGVSIGNKCVIGANSFVNQSVPDRSIAAGTPAKVIGEVVFNEEGIPELVYFPK